MTTPTTPWSEVRWGIRRDLQQMLWIEERSFKYPWSEEVFLGHMRHRDCVLLVADSDAGIMGYCLYYLHRNAIEIANLAVHPGYRRNGVGRRFINHLKKRLHPNKRNTLFTVVWERNVDSQLFYRACGFRCRQVLSNHWLDTGDDAYRFEFSATAIVGGGSGINQEIECQGR